MSMKSGHAYCLVDIGHPQNCVMICTAPDHASHKLARESSGMFGKNALFLQELALYYSIRLNSYFSELYIDS